MLNKLKSALNRLRRSYDYATFLLDEMRKSNAMVTLLENQNAILFGVAETLKRLGEFDHLRIEVQKANQLMNMAAAELAAFNDYSGTLRRRLDRIEQGLANLGGFSREDQDASWASTQPEAEVMLMQHLYAFLPGRVAVSIGADSSDVAAALLHTGYEVYVFAPHQEAHDALSSRCGGFPGFHASRTPDGVRSIESLHASGELPEAADLVMIDAGESDVEMIRGMGDRNYSVVVVERASAGNSENRDSLRRTAGELRARGYSWLIHIFRKEGSAKPAFFVNWDKQHPRTGGSTFFFRDRDLFRIAAQWCERNIPCAPVPFGVEQDNRDRPRREGSLTT